MCDPDTETDCVKIHTKFIGNCRRIGKDAVTKRYIAAEMPVFYVEMSLRSTGRYYR